MIFLHNQMYSIEDDVDTTKLLAGFKGYAKENSDKEVDDCIDLLKRDLTYMLTGGYSYKSHTFFENDNLGAIFFFRDTLGAKERAFDIERVFGSKEEYFFTPLMLYLIKILLIE